MTIQQLRTFCSVVEEKSFHRTADRLHMAQASVSQQIAALEKYYDVALFIRRGRSFSITPEGLALYRWAKEILALVDAIPENIKNLSIQSEGKLVIGASTLAGNYILPPVIKEFKERYPKVQLSVHTGYGSEMVDRIKEGTANLAVVGRNLNWLDEGKVRFMPVASDSLSLIAAPDHPFAKREIVYPQELAGEDTFIHSRPGSAMRSMVEHYLKQENIVLKSIIEMGNHETMKRSVEQGVGIALISTVCVGEELACGRLVNVPLLHLEKISRQFVLVSKCTQEYDHLEKAFADILCEHLRGT